MLTHVEHEEVLELKLERPPANALDPALLAALRDAVRAAPDSGARGLVLSGREGMFSAGLDLPVFVSLSRDEIGQAWRDFFDLMSALASSPIPVACALTGHSPAGGCVIALFCDWRVMAEGSFKIGLNEVQVGVRMPRPIHAAAVHVVGARQAERMCNTGALIESGEALRIGLVDELVPVERVVPRAIEWTDELLKLPPTTLFKTRQVTRKALADPFAVRDDESLELFLDEWFSDEAQGAMNAVVAKLKKK